MRKSLHEICIEAVEKMVADDITRHISYISPEDNLSFCLKHGGKIPKVTIEWVDEAESFPKSDKQFRRTKT
jgi:hypothetical protein